MNEPEEVKPPTVMNVALKYGLVSAGAGILVFVVRALVTDNPFDRSWGWTLVSIAIWIALIILAQREFKNNGDGYMSYGQGFGIGMLLCLVSIVISGLFTMFYGAVIDTNLMNAMYDAQRDQMATNNNMTDEQIETAISITKKFFWVFYFIGGAFFSAFFVLIVTIFTQKRNPEPQI